MTQRNLIAAAFALTLATPATHAQSSLPATPPTQSAVGPIAATPTVIKGRRAAVTFNAGLLQVRADNSSLNVILRDIARVTGMTISGGVVDQRVFGNYGPADPGTVIATLLGGTGVNVFVTMDEASNAPVSLTLTPRIGGVTPPNPNAPSFDEEARGEEVGSQPAPQPVSQPASQPAAQPATATAGSFTNNPVPIPTMDNSYNPNNSNSASTTPVPDPSVSPVSTPPQIAQPLNNVNGDSANRTPSVSEIPTVQSVPTNALPTPSTTPSSSGIVDTPNGNAAGTNATPAVAAAAPATAGASASSVTTSPDGTTTTTTVTSPNGVATPDDIYKKLLALQQAQQKAASGSSTTTTTTPPK